MIKALKHFWHRLCDRVKWVVVYPDSKRSIKLSWSIARDYAKIFKGRVVHTDDRSKPK
jgi:hypothetical protein